MCIQQVLVIIIPVTAIVQAQVTDVLSGAEHSAYTTHILVDVMSKILQSYFMGKMLELLVPSSPMLKTGVRHFLAFT